MLIDEIQQRLREAIKFSGMTQTEIAKKIGINPSTVSKYTRIDKFPAIDTFAKLCAVLDVSADYILGLQESPDKK
jgi:Helix-turn-helix.